MTFYVYAYLDPRTSVDLKIGNRRFGFLPMYIGKGKNDRCWVHLQHFQEKGFHPNPKFSNKLNKLESIDLEPIVVILRKFKIEEKAYAYEEKLIDGLLAHSSTTRRSLCNLTRGGLGLRSADESVIKKISESSKKSWSTKTLDERKEHGRRVMNGWIKNSVDRREANAKAQEILAKQKADPNSMWSKKFPERSATSTRVQLAHWSKLKADPVKYEARRKKLSASLKKAFEDPQLREQNREAQKRSWQTVPESKRRAVALRTEEQWSKMTNAQRSKMHESRCKGHTLRRLKECCQSDLLMSAANFNIHLFAQLLEEHRQFHTRERVLTLDPRLKSCMKLLNNLEYRDNQEKVDRLLNNYRRSFQ